MKQVKFQTASEVKELCAAIDGLNEDKRLANELDKRIKARKTIIRQTLIDKRGIDIDTLPEAETVLVIIGTERGLKIDRKGSDRVNIEQLRACNPDIAKQFTKRTVATYFDVIS